MQKFIKAAAAMSSLFLKRASKLQELFAELTNVN